jgi:hypothetical protein
MDIETVRLVIFLIVLGCIMLFLMIMFSCFPPDKMLRLTHSHPRNAMEAYPVYLYSQYATDDYGGTEDWPYLIALFFNRDEAERFVQECSDRVEAMGIPYTAEKRQEGWAEKKHAFDNEFGCELSLSHNSFWVGKRPIHIRGTIK